MLPKGQHSWNISVMKEARVDPKVVLELSTECSSGESFFVHKKNPQNKQTYFKTILQAFLLVTKQAEYTDSQRGQKWNMKNTPP